MYVLPPVPRCSDWASSSLISPSRISLPRNCSRVGLHIVLFEACAAFTRVAARTLAPSPICDQLHRRLQPFRHLHDCSGCFRLERSPGGARTHWKAPPSHGAREIAGIQRQRPESIKLTRRGESERECSAQALRHPQAPLCHRQEHHPAVRRKRAAIKRGCDFFLPSMAGNENSGIVLSAMAAVASVKARKGFASATELHAIPAA